MIGCPAVQQQYRCPTSDRVNLKLFAIVGSDYLVLYQWGACNCSMVQDGFGLEVQWRKKQSEVNRPNHTFKKNPAGKAGS